jgi:putative Mn2+ efflux pump MntP
MGLLETVLIAFGLAMDAFAVSIAAGLVISPLTGRHVFRASFHFGLFQFLMPVLGWAAGLSVASLISSWDHWVAFALLAFIGGKMLLEARRDDEERSAKDPTRGWSLVTLSVATSIDALAVGLSIAFLEVSIWQPAIIIGVVCAAMSALGITFGNRIGRRWGRWAGALGGLVLVGIGVRILVSHLTSGPGVS